MNPARNQISDSASTFVYFLRNGSVARALEALDVTLTADDMAALDAAFPVGAAAGTRYPEEMMSRVHV